MKYRWNYRKCLHNMWALARILIVIVLFLGIISFNPYGVYTGTI